MFQQAQMPLIIPTNLIDDLYKHARNNLRETLDPSIKDIQSGWDAQSHTWGEKVYNLELAIEVCLAKSDPDCRVKFYSNGCMFLIVAYGFAKNKVQYRNYDLQDHTKLMEHISGLMKELIVMCKMSM